MQRTVEILPGLVRVNNIREFHFSRNPKIVELLNEYDLVKEFGEGVDRIYRDMAEAGLPEPEYRQSEFMLYATLKNKNWGKEDASWTNSITSEGVSEGASEGAGEEAELLQRVVEFCTLPKSKAEIQEYCGFRSDRYVRQQVIQPLLEQGRLIRTIPEKPSSPKQKYLKK